MICQFCGSTLEDYEQECPYCGHKTGVEDPAPSVEDAMEYEEAVSYEPEEEIPPVYDEGAYTEYEEEALRDDEEYSDEEYLDQDQDQEEYQYEEESKSSVKDKAAELLSKFGSISKSSSKSSSKAGETKQLNQSVLVICMGVCALLCLITLVKVIGLSNELDALEQTMLSQLYQIQSANNDISNSISKLNGDVSAVSTTISEANDSKNITITRNPSSDATYLGRGSDSDVTQNSPIFYAEASGAITSVDWQVKENGEWVTLTWDQSSNNSAYGFHIYNEITSSAAHSELCSRNVTALAFDKQYRCVFTDSTGSKATEVVTLTERAA